MYIGRKMLLLQLVSDSNSHLYMKDTSQEEEMEISVWKMV